MKALHKVLAVGAIAIVAAITSIKVISHSTGEPAKSHSIDISTEKILAINPGYLDSLRASQPQTVESILEQLPFVLDIYFHP